MRCQVALQAADVGHSHRGDQQAGDSEAASHRQLSSWEGMLDAADGGFDGGTKVRPLSQQCSATAPALRCIDLLLCEDESEALVTLARIGPALAGSMQRAG